MSLFDDESDDDACVNRHRCPDNDTCTIIVEDF